MEKIAILYVCTGEYTVFWKEFYLSFERFFLPNTEKHYFVFGDNQMLYMEGNSERIHKHLVPHLPWPLPTLLRFWFFSEIKSELKEFDYICLMNANVICRDYVLEEEYLPRGELGEKFMVTVHPGYEDQNPVYFPYERRKNCEACIPYHKGERYVFGAMNGGCAVAYLEMIEDLKNKSVNDLKKGIIAKCHDESYINAYMNNRTDVRYLSKIFCYPEGWGEEQDCKILGLDKAKVLNVDYIKKAINSATQRRTLFRRVIDRLKKRWDKISPHLKKVVGLIGDKVSVKKCS